MSYEFTPFENQTFAALASKMKFISTISIIAGLLPILLLGVGGYITGSIHGNSSAISLAVMGGIVGGLLGLSNLINGISIRNAANALKSISETQGADISYLMTAMGSLHTYFAKQYWLLLLPIAFVALIILVAIVKGPQ